MGRRGAALRVAGLLLSPVVVRRGLARDRLGWPGLAVIIAGVGAPYVLVAAAGLRFAPASDQGALNPGCMPLFVALIAAAVLRERLEATRKLGLALILAGALINTNAAEGFFSRMRRAEIGHHHHLAGPYLIRFAQEAAWREDHRRDPNGSQVDRGGTGDAQQAERRFPNLAGIAAQVIARPKKNRAGKLSSRPGT